MRALDICGVLSVVQYHLTIMYTLAAIFFSPAFKLYNISIIYITSGTADSVGNEYCSKTVKIEKMHYLCTPCTIYFLSSPGLRNPGI
jgi:hypothetical protein